MFLLEILKARLQGGSLSAQGSERGGIRGNSGMEVLGKGLG